MSAGEMLGQDVTTRTEAEVVLREDRAGYQEELADLGGAAQEIQS